MNQSGVQVNGINKRFGKSQVLFDISLDIPQGTIFGLIGPSGCGKSTLVKIMAGILGKYVGAVHVNGMKMPSRKALFEVGYMAQAAALYPTLTGRENLKFFGNLYGIKGKELQDRIESLASLVDLSDALQKTAENYSGGMKQRLSLACALIANPKVLILDEPTVGIDPVLRQEIWAELRDLAQNGVTILITTHVMDEAEKCDSLAMMREGHILAVGSAVDLIQQAGARNFEEAFIHFGAKGGENHENESDNNANHKSAETR